MGNKLSPLVLPFSPFLSVFSGSLVLVDCHVSSARPGPQPVTLVSLLPPLVTGSPSHGYSPLFIGMMKKCCRSCSLSYCMMGLVCAVCMLRDMAAVLGAIFPLLYASSSCISIPRTKIGALPFFLKDSSDNSVLI